MILAETDYRTWMMLAGVALVIFFLLRANRQRLSGGVSRRRDDGDGDTGDRRASARAAQQVRDQLDELMVQLEELARQTHAQIETRSARLEILLGEADHKIDRLQKLLEEVDGRSHPSPSPETPRDNPEHVEVYKLSDDGRTPVQIARQLGRDVGEIELILALRRR